MSHRALGHRKLARVFRGLIDCAVGPIAFIGSWFSDSIGIYGIPNCSGWYDFGFLLGLTIWAGGGYAAKRRRHE